MADRPKSVTSVSIKAANGTDEPPSNVGIGSAIEFAALASRLDGTSDVVPASSVEWRSSDTEKAEFEGCRLTGKNEGNVQVTATVDDVESAPLTVTVTAA